ncbi:MAG: hypothetical protein IJY27_04525 [Clostridia bacterium]|nr:hypothetical protein [Clostridia bacterium]
MKRLFVMIAALALCFVLASCDETAQNDFTTPPALSDVISAKSVRTGNISDFIGE